LEELVLGFTDTKDGLQYLSNCKNIRILTFPKMSFEGVGVLNDFPRLEELDLSCVSGNDGEYRNLFAEPL
jgi:hypothetical protein